MKLMSFVVEYLRRNAGVDGIMHWHTLGLSSQPGCSEKKGRVKHIEPYDIHSQSY